MKTLVCLEVTPNHDKKSTIVSYKEKVVRKVMEIGKSLPADVAEELLVKAEGFVRPKLPDFSARVTLLKLLQLRADLSSTPQGTQSDAVQQLMSLVAEDPDKSVEAVGELLANFEPWHVASHLHKFKQEFVAVLQTSARGPPVAPCAETLDRELASRLGEALQTELQHAPKSVLRAPKSETPFFAFQLMEQIADVRNPVQKMEQNAEKLWDFVFCLSRLEDPGIWVDGAGLVLAALRAKLKVELPSLPDEVLYKASYFLKERKDACARAQELFRSDLGVATETEDSKTFRTELLMQLFKRRPKDSLDLLSALVADSDEEAQDNLLKTLLQSDGSDDATAGDDAASACGVECDCESVLVKLLFARRGGVPGKLLQKLALESSDSDSYIHKLAPETSLALASQLVGAERPVEGARIAVIASKVFDSLGSTERSEKALARAYGMDPCNAEAAEGMLSLLLGDLEKRGHTEQERLLLTLLFEHNRMVPDHLLPSLPLEPHEIRQVPPEAALSLAEQLWNSNRRAAGAQVAVLAAQAFDELGSQEEAYRAYVRAHSMDSLNTDASNGLLSATSRSCQELAALVKQQQTTIDQLRKLSDHLAEEVEGLRNHVQARDGRGIIWDLSGQDLVEGFCKESPKINLENGSDSKHVQACLGLPQSFY